MIVYINRVFPKLRLNKFAKLVKRLTSDQNFDGSQTQALELQV